MALSCKSKQAEQVMQSKLGGRVSLWLRFRSCLQVTAQVPATSSLSDGLLPRSVSLYKPFPLQLGFGQSFITVRERKTQVGPHICASSVLIQGAVSLASIHHAKVSKSLFLFVHLLVFVFIVQTCNHQGQPGSATLLLFLKDTCAHDRHCSFSCWVQATFSSLSIDSGFWIQGIIYLVSSTQHASKGLAFPVQIANLSLPLSTLSAQRFSTLRFLPIFKKAFWFGFCCCCLVAWFLLLFGFWAFALFCLTRLSVPRAGMGPLQVTVALLPPGQPHYMISLFLIQLASQPGKGLPSYYLLLPRALSRPGVERPLSKHML